VNLVAASPPPPDNLRSGQQGLREVAQRAHNERTSRVIEMVSALAEGTIFRGYVERERYVAYHT
jgi:hypothetical protein